MTNLQKIQIRQSEVRERLNELSGMDSLTDEQGTELEKLSNEFQDLEKRFRAAVLAEPETTPALDKPDGEGAETRALVGRSKLSAFLTEVVSGQPLAGSSPEAELRSSLLGESAQPGFVPWAMIAPEVRVDAATSAPATGLARNQAAVLGRVFAASATQYLGIQMPSVPVGQASYPVLTSGAAGTQAAAGTAVDAVAAVFAATALNPVRLTARYQFDVADAARMPMLEDSLRGDLSRALSDAMDSQILNGDGSAPNVSGLLDALTDPANPGSRTGWADYVQAVAASVDGRYANGPGQIRMLMGPGLYADAATTLHATASVSAAARYIQEIASLQVSANLPAPGGTPTIGRALIARTGAPGAVAPVWEGVQLVRDPFSGAQAGQVNLTAVALWAFAVIRAEAFAIRKFRLSS